MRKSIVISIVCLGIYAAFGFFAAPRLLTAKLPEIVQESVPATLSLGSIKVNPFTLSVTAHQLELQSDQGEPLAAADRIHFNAQASSRFRRALYLKAVLEAQAIEPGRIFLLAPAVVPGGREPVVRIEMSSGAGT